MAIHRRPGPAHTVTALPPGHTVYEVTLGAIPSPAWRAAFLRSPTTLTSARYLPELGRLGLDGTRVHFQTAPSGLRLWLRRIDRWVQYANSVVEE